MQIMKYDKILVFYEKTAFYLYLQGETDQVDGKQEKALDIQSGL